MGRVSREYVEWLTNKACLSADTVALDNQMRSMTGAQKTHAIVERTIEFLFGNGLVEPIPIPPNGILLRIDPPFDSEKLEEK